MTIAQKILAAHSGHASVEPGEYLTVKIDLAFTMEGYTPLVVDAFKEMGATRAFDPKKVVFFDDHTTPSKDISSAEQSKIQREFARRLGAAYLDVGRAGIEHVVVPEFGLALPGQVVVGADSHTTTYGALGVFSTGMGATDIAVAMALGEVWMKVPPTVRLNYWGVLPKWVSGKDLILHTLNRIGVDGALYSAIEFGGDVIPHLDMDDRFTMANMSVEAGAKVGLFSVDEKTEQYIREHGNGSYTAYEADADAEYSQVVDIDVSNLEPQVAPPDLPSNGRPIGEIGNVEINQVVIGCCTNGRISDLRIAARLLEGRTIHPNLRCVVIPGSREVYLKAIDEGLIRTFVMAGVAVSPPTCGPCAGLHMGVLAAGERALATTNRNFVGRMGSPQSEVWLASPAVAAASAVLGRIAAPGEVLK